MARIYHMIVEPRTTYGFSEEELPVYMRRKRKEYQSTKQGSAPAGYVCVAVCGYHDEPSRKGARG